MLHANVTQARAGFTDLIRNAQKEPTIIIQRSKPVAVLLSFAAFEKLQKRPGVEQEEYLNMAQSSPAYGGFLEEKDHDENLYSEQDIKPLNA